MPSGLCYLNSWTGCGAWLFTIIIIIIIIIIITITTIL